MRGIAKGHKQYHVSFVLDDNCKPKPLTKQELKDAINTINLPAGLKMTRLYIIERERKQ